MPPLGAARGRHHPENETVSVKFTGKNYMGCKSYRGLPACKAHGAPSLRYGRAVWSNKHGEILVRTVRSSCSRQNSSPCLAPLGDITPHRLHPRRGQDSTRLSPRPLLGLGCVAMLAPRRHLGLILIAGVGSLTSYLAPCLLRQFGHGIYPFPGRI